MKQRIHVGFETLRSFLLDPHNLRSWTAHRTIYQQGRKYFEVRLLKGRLQDVEVQTAYEPLGETGGIVTFTWLPGNTVRFRIAEADRHTTAVEVRLPESVPADLREKMLHIIGIELDVLKIRLEGGPEAEIPAGHLQAIHQYHQSLYHPA